jgi:hypothetical protein
MTKTLLQKIGEKEGVIRENAQKYFELSQNKSDKMESHSVEGGDYIPVTDFRKSIPYSDFEKVVSKYRT